MKKENIPHRTEDLPGWVKLVAEVRRKTEGDKNVSNEKSP